MRKSLLAIFFLSLCLMGHTQALTPGKCLADAELQFRALATYSCILAFEVAGGDHSDAGKVYVQGLKYHMDFPEDQTIFDGTVIMNWAKPFGMVNVSSPPKGADFSFTGIYRLHREPFLFEWKDSTETTRTMQLSAMDEGMAVVKLLVTTHKQTKLITGYSLLTRSGVHVTYQVKEELLNPGIDPKLLAIDWEFIRKVQSGEIPPVEHRH